MSLLPYLVSSRNHNTVSFSFSQSWRRALILQGTFFALCHLQSATNRRRAIEKRNQLFFFVHKSNSRGAPPMICSGTRSRSEKCEILFTCYRLLRSRPESVSPSGAYIWSSCTLARSFCGKKSKELKKERHTRLWTFSAPARGRCQGFYSPEKCFLSHIVTFYLCQLKKIIIIMNSNIQLCLMQHT